jgi:phage terminase large subunit-like protein
VIILWFILLPPDSIKSACKLAEDSYKDILWKSTKTIILLMIHQMDADDDWEDEKNWEKANPNVQFNATLMDFMRH